MDTGSERKLRAPKKQQREGLANALVLRQHCEALGLEWDGEILAKDSWDLDGNRYIALRLKVLETLCARLGMRMPDWLLYEGPYVEPRFAFKSYVSYADLMDIGRRAGWIC
jgi:hypothetical protein